MKEKIYLSSDHAGCKLKNNVKKYLEDKNSKFLVDYKFFCFNGEPKFYQTCYDRNNDLGGAILNFYDIKGCKIDLQDEITIKMNRIEEIRENDDYNGYRLTFEAKYLNSMPVIMRIDVTTGDKITYREIEYSFELMLEERKIQVWSYNVETVISEKFEAIIKRGVLGTRIRDFYDVYMLLKTQKKNINNKTLKVAINYTTEHRKSTEEIKNWKEVVEELENDETMKNQWRRYQKNNFYAEGIEYDDLIESIKVIGNIYDL